MILKKGMDFKEGQVFFLLDDFVRRNGVGSDHFFDNFGFEP